MIWIAIILGLFLFYKFVERKHKVLTFKAIGVLSLLVGVLIGGNLGYNSWQTRRRENGISVELLYKDLQLSKKQQQQIANETFLLIYPNVTRYYYHDITVADSFLLKKQLYSYYMDSKNAQDDVSDASYDHAILHTLWSENKNTENEIKLRQFENQLMKNLIDELPMRRSKAVDTVQKMLLSSFLDHSIQRFSFDDLRKNFREKLTKDENVGIDTFVKLKNIAEDEIFLSINARKDLKTILTFNICNKLDRPLESYSFTVSGFERGRSTAQALKKTVNYGSETSFFGDTIIEPKKCVIIDWVDNYKFYNRYEIKNVKALWGN